MSLSDHVPAFLDGEQSETEAKIARAVVPLVAGVAATAVGMGVAQACCGLNYRKRDPKGLLPMTMAALTAGVAAWSYFNPPPDKLKQAARAVGDCVTP